MPRSVRRAAPYLFLLPGGLWLVFFFVIPMLAMLSVSLQEGSLETGYRLTLNFGIYPQVISDWSLQFSRSFIYALMVTGLTLLLGYPLAYFIAFRGGRAKNYLLLLVILPFFTAFIIRTLSWKLILADNGFVLGSLKDLGLLASNAEVLSSPVAVIGGLTYNFLPFMVLPLYVSLEKIDRNMVEAATDLYANRAGAFLRVTLPLSMPGVLAGPVLVALPMFGDYYTPDLVSASTKTNLIGNQIDQFTRQGSQKVTGAVLTLLLAVFLLVLMAYYLRSTRRAGAAVTAGR
jgi:spermidine/putrescine transport system permease protein